MISIDDRLSEIRWIRNEIWRCRRLLETELPGAEREVVEKRLLEQLSDFKWLLQVAFPLTLCSEVNSTKIATIGPSGSTEAPIESAAMASTDRFGMSIGS
ncbi:hypothetical protein [Bradyrhizobium sp. 6(2017)]|uniref:hypothetical protein n=1 Tax=Bradyrhizobium sp. 6(2017) TaxID=1197460 RepID=UPI0013E1F218|nr:hypothetical protein [Bradyrhizobium sp. 6(2017)]QIG97827.1 hypothetical protein G6P99_39675 [Bradyrhizobium sp. 6(2017)]